MARGRKVIREPSGEQGRKVIREPSGEQLVASVQQHAREVHDMNLTREQVLSMAEPV